MFTVTDFLNLLKYVQDPTITSTLDKNLKSLSIAEQAKVKQFFEATIDQNSFNTDDYKRLKNFFVDWYAAHRTIISTQKNALDPHALPEDHLNELIKAFGFDVPSSFKVLPYSNKPSFFLDLINLYKIKGTPQAIIKLLAYFGISNMDFIEYWLRKDSNNNLVFRSETVLSSVNKNVNINKDLDFNSLTISDPHWFLTESQVLEMFDNNKIRFPSKSPYFGLRPTIHLNELEYVISIITRQCQNEYNTWLSSGELNKTIDLTGIKMTVSLLELYTGLVYGFDKKFPRDNNIIDQKVICYNGDATSIITNEIILKEYKNLIGSKRLLPVDYIISRVSGRENRQNQLYEYYDKFTIPEHQYFLSDSTAGTLFNLLNPDLKTIVDGYFSVNAEDEIAGLIRDLGTWVSSTLGLEYTNISNLILGLPDQSYLTEIINFFKPYRARLILTENVFLIDNPLADYQPVEDELGYIEEINMFLDFDTADSIPGFPIGWIPTGEYVTSTPPITDSTGVIGFHLDSTSQIMTNQIPSHVDPLHKNTRILAMYVDSTGEVKVEYDDIDSTSVITTFIYSNPVIGAYRINNIYLSIEPDSSRKLVVDFEDTPETVGGVSTKITSLPPSYIVDSSISYIIKDVYLNYLGMFAMVYNSEPYNWETYESDEIKSSRVYYSRNTFDNGSYFDIGASSDNPPNEPDMTIIDNFIDKYNNHKPSTSGVPDISRDVGFNYVFDNSGILTPEHISYTQYGGFTNFDQGGILDAPFASEVFHITIVNI